VVQHGSERSVVLTARYVVPVDRPPIREGGICIQDGCIARVAPRQDLPGEPVEDLGDAVLLPGFINAHTHLELSGYAGRLKPSSLWKWLARLVRLRRKADPHDEQASAARAAAESLQAGVTCIVDISRRGDTWSALRSVPIRKVCVAELLTLAKHPPRNPAELVQAVEAVPADDRLLPGVSPHAPYTVRGDHLAETVQLARRRGWPITTHWAETREECRWLMRGGGVLGALIRSLGGADSISSPRCPPIVYAERLGLLSMPALLAHVNYITDEELDRLREGSAAVVYCPRSHRFFGHKRHRWRDMLEAGVTVCVGTDSAASLPAGATLSVLDELRFLHREHPDVPPETLLSMATLSPARALGLDGQIGSLTPGKRGDLVAVPLSGPDVDDPLSDLLTSDVRPMGVWIDGERYVPPQTPSPEMTHNATAR